MRIRNKSYNTVHHLMSRIAHQVFFLEKDEQRQFLDLVKRVSAFTGVELIGWCIMNNHFHLYAYLPVPKELSDEEVLTRLKFLKEDASRISADDFFDGRTVNPGQTSFDKSNGLDEIVASARRRMYSVAEFMRMIKQWFSEDYNARHGHKGTMWAETYRDKTMFLPERHEEYADLRDVLAYIHLNPIRAAITDRFDGYCWSSYAAFLSGDKEAAEGMRRAYPGMSDAEILVVHESRMNDLLEDEKRKRAMAIARKRRAGIKMPCDPLTDEAMVAQAKDKLEKIQRLIVEMNAERDQMKNQKGRKDILCQQIVCELMAFPEASAVMLSTLLGVHERTVYRCVNELSKRGVISRENRESPWRVEVVKLGQTLFDKIRMAMAA